MSIQSSLRMREAEMFALIREYLQSGQNQKQFCSAKKLSKSTFYYWLRKFRKSDTAQPDSFIPLHTTQVDSFSRCRITFPNGVQIRLNGSEEIDFIMSILSKAVTFDVSAQ